MSMHPDDDDDNQPNNSKYFTDSFPSFFRLQ